MRTIERQWIKPLVGLSLVLLSPFIFFAVFLAVGTALVFEWERYEDLRSEYYTKCRTDIHMTQEACLVSSDREARKQTWLPPDN